MQSPEVPTYDNVNDHQMIIKHFLYYLFRRIDTNLKEEKDCTKALMFIGNQSCSSGKHVRVIHTPLHPTSI